MCSGKVTPGCSEMSINFTGGSINSFTPPSGGEVVPVGRIRMAGEGERMCQSTQGRAGPTAVPGVFLRGDKEGGGRWRRETKHLLQCCCT